MSNSSDSDLKYRALTNATAATVVTLSDFTSVSSCKYRCGSRSGRAVYRDFDTRAKSIQLDNAFCKFHQGSLLSTESEFERTYKMPRAPCQRIRADRTTHSAYFQAPPGAAGRREASTNLKIHTAILMLAEGRNAFPMVKEVRQSEQRSTKFM